MWSLARRAPQGLSEVQRLIARMASESFLWDAPRIHGELLMLRGSANGEESAKIRLECRAEHLSGDRRCEYSRQMRGFRAQ